MAAPRPGHARRLPAQAASATPRSTGDGESSPALADLDGDNRQRADRRRQRRLRPRLPARRHRAAAAGRCAATSPASCTPAAAPSTSGEVDDQPRRRDPRLGRGRRRRPRRHPRGLRRRPRGQGLRLGRRAATPLLPARVEPRLLRQAAGARSRTSAGARRTAPSTGSSARRCSPTSTATPAARDRRRRRWTATSTRGTRTAPPSPASRSWSSTRPRSRSIDPTTHRVTFQRGAGAEHAGRDHRHPRGRRPRRRRRRHRRRRAARDRRRHQRGVRRRPTTAASTPTRSTAASSTCSSSRAQLDPGNSRLYALKASGDGDADPTRPAAAPASAFRGGWPVRDRRSSSPSCCPIVGEGITGSPVIGPVTCAIAGGAGPEGRRRSRTPASPTSSTRTASSCYGQDGGQATASCRPTFGASAAASSTRPMLPAVGHPAFGNLGGAGPELPRPGGRRDPRARPRASTSTRAARTSSMAWNAETVRAAPGFPGVVNDLQFLTGPSIADIDGVPGEEVVARHRLRSTSPRFSAAGDRGPGLAEADRRLDGGQPDDRQLRHPRRRPRLDQRGQGRDRAHPLGLHPRLRHRRGRLHAVAPGRASTTTTPTRATTSRDAVLPGQADSTRRSRPGGAPSIEFDAPGRRPALRHRRPLRDRHLRRPDRRVDDFDDADSARDERQRRPRRAPRRRSRSPTAPSATSRSAPSTTRTTSAAFAAFDRGAAAAGRRRRRRRPRRRRQLRQRSSTPARRTRTATTSGDACDPDRRRRRRRQRRRQLRRRSPTPTRPTTTATAWATPATRRPATRRQRCRRRRQPGLDAPPRRLRERARRDRRQRPARPGPSAGDLLRGLRGRDRINGLAGDDCLFGNKGGDRVDGGAGADQLSGGNSRDRVIGGPGIDTIRAGNGDDRDPRARRRGGHRLLRQGDRLGLSGPAGLDVAADCEKRRYRAEPACALRRRASSCSLRSGSEWGSLVSRQHRRRVRAPPACEPTRRAFSWSQFQARCGTDGLSCGLNRSESAK